MLTEKSLVEGESVSINGNSDLLLNKKAIKLSPNILTLLEDKNIDKDALCFIVNYMNFCSEEEPLPPEYPLENLDLSIIFEFERQIFGNLILFNNNIQVIVSKINYIKKILNLAAYLELQNLFKKLSAILAFYIKTLELSELEDVIKKLR